jgi:polar amino acid transport system substrate-binding protein
MWVSLVGVVALAGCGSSSSTSTKFKAAATPPAGSSTSTAATTSTSAATSTAAAPSTPIPTPAANAAAEALVPSAIKSKGTITVAADASYAPDEFFASNGTTVIGMDADLSTALAAVMGLKANVVNATFDTIIPGLASGKFDMGASSFTDTKAREKVVDFVDYANVGESFYTKAQGGTTIGSIADICGKTVSVEKGTTEETDAGTQSGKCTKAGKPGVTVLSYTDQNGANLAVASGRAQLGFADTPVASYQVKQTGGQFKLIGTAYAPAPYGIAISKKPGLAPAVLAALKVLMKDGTYAAIFTKWGLQGIAITSPKINGATS